MTDQSTGRLQATNKLPESMNAVRLYLDELAQEQHQMTLFLVSSSW
jgi:hypothetical protein